MLLPLSLSPRNLTPVSHRAGKSATATPKTSPTTSTPKRSNPAGSRQRAPTPRSSSSTWPSTTAPAPAVAAREEPLPRVRSALLTCSSSTPVRDGLRAGKRYVGAPILPLIYQAALWEGGGVKLQYRREPRSEREKCGRIVTAQLRKIPPPRGRGLAKGTREAGSKSPLIRNPLHKLSETTAVFFKDVSR